MADILFHQVSSLEKVFLEYKKPEKEFCKMSAFKNERISYQIAFCGQKNYQHNFVKVEINSPLKEYVSIFEVGNVPVEFPFRVNFDEHYEKTSPGLFPDVLYPIKNNKFIVSWQMWHSLWITLDLDGKVKAGKYPVELVFTYGEETQTKIMEVEILDANLPEQDIKVTQWFHGDCIADYYNLPVFSEKHWELIESFIKTATKNGINMLLTPIFTPPLDTEIGGERTTIQLVDIFKDANGYSFDFERLNRWITLCQKHGIKYFEMAHLFTQWGAKATPKIFAEIDGEKKKIFGWEVASNSPEYEEFLKAFLPALAVFLKEKGVFENTVFHISDEPQPAHLEYYLQMKALARKYLPDATIIDAASSYDLFKQGQMDIAVPASDHIEKFIENNVENLWVYYCCDQGVGVANRFIAMPSYRNRVIATQMYKFGIKGFLHWGYNFYSTSLSRKKINPFIMTDAGNVFPSGDAFSVYPGEDGALESLRIIVFNEALQDLRAFKLLESFIGKDAVTKLIEDTANMEIRFDKYPHNKEFLLSLREKVNQEIAKYI